MSLLEFLQSAVWILQSSREQLQSFFSWMIVAQVQFPQVEGVGAQS